MSVELKLSSSQYCFLSNEPALTEMPQVLRSIDLRVNEAARRRKSSSTDIFGLAY